MLRFVLRAYGPSHTATPVDCPLDATVTFAGRDPACGLVLADDEVSWRHAAFVLTVGGVVVLDMRSANGVFLEEKRVDHAFLQEGDRLRVGGTTLAVRVEHGTDGAIPEAAGQAAFVARLLEAAVTRGGGSKPDGPAPSSLAARLAHLLAELPSLLRCEGRAAVVERALAMAVDLLDADRAYVAHRNERGDYVVDARTLREGKPQPADVPDHLHGNRLRAVKQAVDEGRPLSLASLITLAPPGARASGEPCVQLEPIGSFAVAPRSHGTGTFVLCADTRMGGALFDEGSAWLLGLIAAHVAAALPIPPGQN